MRAAEAWQREGRSLYDIEDETGVAQGILWPDRLETYRRTVLSSSMVSLRGRLQKEGELIHVIVQKVTNLTRMLDSVDAPVIPAPSRPW